MFLDSRKRLASNPHTADSVQFIVEAHLWQLFGDASEDMVVEVPGLRQVLHITRAHVLPAPVLSLHQVPAVRLQQTSAMTYAKTGQQFGRAGRLQSMFNIKIPSWLNNDFSKDVF